MNTEAVGCLSLVDQQPVLRQHDHHAGGLNLVDSGDGAGQFALQRPGLIGALDEVRYAEVRFVEDFEADAVAAGGMPLPASCIRMRWTFSVGTRTELPPEPIL